MPVSQELEAVNNAIEKCDPVFLKGLTERLNEEEITQVLSTLLFEITNNSKNRLVEVRNYDKIAQKGAFRYSGKADTMLKEGLMPENIFNELRSLPGMKDDTRHMGPSYLRVKGLLTHHPIRNLFGTQMAFKIDDRLEDVPLEKPDGYVVCIPNMTGGVYIGDKTSEKLQKLSRHKIWPATPYFREARKAIEVIKPQEKLEDSVEGIMPTPDITAAINCFEELRTACETTKNATDTYRHFGYTPENGVRIDEDCVFDYGHPAGVERLRRLGVSRIYLVDGKKFMETSRKLGYISDSQCQTAKDWLEDPWKFTEKILPDVKKL